MSTESVITRKGQDPSSLVDGRSIDFNGFRARVRSRNNSNPPRGHSEALAEEIDQGLVRRPVDRSRRQSDLDRVAVRAGQLVPRRPRLHVDREANAAVASRDPRSGLRQLMIPRTIQIRTSAAIGLRSRAPNGGMIRRRGASSHSVDTYDQRTQTEKGDIGSQDENTRTRIAM
jgi:hypothetical protein